MTEQAFWANDRLAIVEAFVARAAELWREQDLGGPDAAIARRIDRLLGDACGLIEEIRSDLRREGPHA